MLQHRPLVSDASAEMVVTFDPLLAPQGVEDHRTELLTISAFRSTNTVDVEITVELDPYGAGGGCLAAEPHPLASVLVAAALLISLLRRSLQTRPVGVDIAERRSTGDSM